MLLVVAFSPGIASVWKPPILFCWEQEMRGEGNFFSGLLPYISLSCHFPSIWFSSTSGMKWLLFWASLLIPTASEVPHPVDHISSASLGHAMYFVAR